MPARPVGPVGPVSPGPQDGLDQPSAALGRARPQRAVVQGGPFPHPVDAVALAARASRDAVALAARAAALPSSATWIRTSGSS